MELYQLEINKILEQFGVNVESGLPSSDIESRLKKYGYNFLPREAAASALWVFLSQFLSPLMVVLLFAAIASLVIGEAMDAIVIGIAVFINVVVGFIQEWKAERASEALISYEVPECEVKRDSKVIIIKSNKLVPGDIVLLKSGNRVPADIRLCETIDLSIEEALLTGESRPSKKTSEVLSGDHALGDRENMAFLGTFVVAGRAEGVVVATGEHTELGKIAKLASRTEEAPTPIQKQLVKLSWILGLIMVVVSASIFVLGYIAGFSFKKIITVSIALAVASIPEGLLISMTVILAIGMQRMLKKKALVKKLIAAETLGGVSVICTDKTGTLTQGILSVSRIITRDHDVKAGDKVPDDIYDALVMGALNNDASIGADTSSEESALLNFAISAGVDVAEKRKKFPRIDEIPFSSKIKYMATLHKGNKNRLIVKGAPEVVFNMCLQDESSQDSLDFFKIHVDKMTKEGHRVLALAYKDDASIDSKDLNIVALFVFDDLLRTTAKDTVKQLKEAGIRTVIVTGDNANTASEIAHAAGISVRENGVIVGSELENMTDTDLKDKIETIDVFARVSPSHKVRIVDAWQSKGHAVAMTGDGVNDAPALRKADIGIALGAGSDFSHEIADMVLLDNNLSTIAAAVKEGRIIFDNIRKVIVYLLVDSFSEIVLIAGAIIMHLPLPITAIQILWINIISDGFPSIALTVEPGEEGIMKELPRNKKEPLLNNDMKIIIFLVGIITDIGLFGLFWMMLKYNYNLNHIQTIMFTALAIDSLVYVFSVRTMRSSIFRTNPFSNIWLCVAVVIGFVIQLSTIYIPFLQKLFSTVALNGIDLLIITVLSLFKLAAIEITKDILHIHRNK